MTTVVCRVKDKDPIHKYYVYCAYKAPANKAGLLRIIITWDYQAIGLMSRVFANGDPGSIPGQVIPKT